MPDKWVKRWRVPSDTDSDKVYTVAKDRFENYGCDCPRWKFARAPKENCKHILDVKAGYYDDQTTKTPPEIVLYMNDQVTYDPETNICKTPLIPIGDTHFQATVVYDLQRYGVPWPIIKDRYDIAKANSRAAIIAYIEQHGRSIYSDWVKDRGYTGQKIVPVEK